MFNSAGEKGENYSEESKYVAKILSNMSNNPAPVSSYAVPSSLSYGITSAATPTSLLTPSTLSNLEQTFIELQSVPVNGQNPLTQSGFVPPVVDIHNDRSNDGYDYGDSSDSDWAPSKKSRGDGGDSHMTDSYMLSGGPGRKGGRRRNDENLSAEEEERRRVRRERNKLAAAKCRQRRVDHTNRLVNETDGLEKERDNLELEIQTLQQEKDQLEFILQAHNPLCKLEVKEKQVQEFSAPSIKIKAEPMDARLNSCATTRPSTLSFKPDKSVGVPITTPSNGFYFSLDNMVDHTGLTPITNGPNVCSTGLTPITNGPHTCSTEASRTTSESSTENASSPTLISL